MTFGTDRVEMSPELADFESRLTKHGADLARWPTSERDATDKLLAANFDARRLLEEAIALERVLDAAVATVSVAPGQVERVLAAALAGRPEVRTSAGSDAAGTVVTLPRRENSAAVGTVPERAPRRATGFGSGTWKAAAVLAFALIGGVAIGALDVAPAMTGLGEMVGLVADSDLVVATFPVEGLDPLIDEDQI